MTVVTNNHTSPLGLPRGLVIQPGASVRVDNWRILRNHAVVAAWLAAGVLSVEDGTEQPAKVERASVAVPVAVSAPVAEAVVDHAVDLRVQYTELFGSEPDGRWGDKRIQDAIDAKLAE